MTQASKASKASWGIARYRVLRVHKSALTKVNGASGTVRILMVAPKSHLRN